MRAVQGAALPMRYNWLVLSGRHLQKGMSCINELEQPCLVAVHYSSRNSQSNSKKTSKCMLQCHGHKTKCTFKCFAEKQWTSFYTALKRSTSSGLLAHIWWCLLINITGKYRDTEYINTELVPKTSPYQWCNFSPWSIFPAGLWKLRNSTASSKR